MSSAVVPAVGIGRVVRSGWWVMLVAALVGAGVGALGWLLWPTSYSALAVVEVGDPSGEASTSVNMETQAAVAASTGVLEQAIDDLGDEWSSRSLSAALGVVVPRGAQVLELQVTAPSPEAAAEAANAVASAYLQDRQSFSQRARAEALDQVEQQVAVTEQQLEDATTEGAQLALQARLDELGGELFELQAPLAPGGRVLSEAQPPLGSSGPGLPVWIGAGFMGGLLVGIYVATVVERTRTSR